VIVYDPADLAFLQHECRAWGIEIAPRLISFNEYLLSLLKSGKLTPRRGEREYTLQDHYAYARELDDTVSARELIAAVGISRDMLLCGKEANLAGHLIMAEYMPDVILSVGMKRWENARGMDCKTLVTESPAEYVCLKATCPEGCSVLSVEEMLLQNL
jgi:Fe-S oxidoreductase